MYVQKQESSLGVNREEQGILPFPWEAAEQYAEGQLQAEMGKVPEECGFNQFWPSYDG